MRHCSVTQRKAPARKQTEFSGHNASKQGAKIQRQRLARQQRQQGKASKHLVPGEQSVEIFLAECEPAECRKDQFPTRRERIKRRLTDTASDRLVDQIYAIATTFSLYPLRPVAAGIVDRTICTDRKDEPPFFLAARCGDDSSSATAFCHLHQ